jgi:hypothetical protein
LLSILSFFPAAAGNTRSTDGQRVKDLTVTMPNPSELSNMDGPAYAPRPSPDSSTPLRIEREAYART